MVLCMKQSRTSRVMALSFGRGLTTVVNLATAMVMARVLTEIELATYRQTLLVYQVALPLLSLGLSNALYYYMPTETKRIRGILIDALIMMLVMGLLYAVFIALGGHRVIAQRFSNPTLASTLVYLLPVPLVMLPVGLMCSVLVVQNQVNKLTVYNVLTSVAFGLGITGACLYWKSPESMVLAKVCISIMSGLVGIRLMLKAVPRDDWRPSWESMKKMVGFSIPLVMAGALGTISLQLDKVIVSVMCSPDEFAVYSNGAMELPFVGILTGSIMAVILPDLRRFAGEHDVANALLLFQKAAIKSAVILIPMMFFLLVSAEPFIVTLFSGRYVGSALPFRLYLFILPMRVVLFGPFLMAFGKNKLIFYRSAAGLFCNAILSFILVRGFGYNGAIIATLIALYGVEGLWSCVAIGSIGRIKWYRILPFASIVKIMLVSSLASLPVFVLNYITFVQMPIVRLLANGIVYVTFICLFIITFRIELFTAESSPFFDIVKKYMRKGKIIR